MIKVMTRPLSPWFDTTQKALQLGSGATPLLLVGPPGSLQVECAKEIHRNSGGGPWERVICTQNSVELRTQLFGPALEPFDEFPLFDPDPPVGAIHRATEGTLFLDFVDQCHDNDADWIPKLLYRQPVTINRYSTSLDPSTRVIASITPSWMDRIEHAVPPWLMASFNDRVLVLKPLGSRPEDVWDAIEWFFWRASKSQTDEVVLSSDAKRLIASRQWPGNYEELRNVVSSLVSPATEGEVVTADTCKQILTSLNSTGMGAVDRNRWQDCCNYARELSYIGRSIDASEVYKWAGQFSTVSRDRRFDPWLPGLTIAKEIAHRYHYSSDKLRILIRDAYLSLCVELANKNYISDWSPAEADVSLPRFQAVLVNPLGPLKSSSGFLPHIARLLGAGNRQKVINTKVINTNEAADYLTRNERIRVMMFCDDYAGTGQQIMSRLIKVFAADKSLQEICECRRQEGNPVTLGVILGISFDDALQKIRTSGPDWLPIMAHAGEQLGEQDRAFSDSSRIFPEPELRAWAKDLVIDQVGQHLSSKWPGGFDNSQALVVTADNVPNNTLPAIWKSGSVQGVEWHALFERASTPSG